MLFCAICVQTLSKVVKHSVPLQARQLATASSRLVTGLKEEAQSLSSNPPAQKKVLGSAKKLADATAKMVESAKGAATHANEEQYQTALKKSTEDLREAVDEAFGNVLRRKVVFPACVCEATDT